MCTGLHEEGKLLVGKMVLTSECLPLAEVNIELACHNGTERVINLG